jgi:hypothetical protein
VPCLGIRHHPPRNNATTGSRLARSSLTPEPEPGRGSGKGGGLAVPKNLILRFLGALLFATARTAAFFARVSDSPAGKITHRGRALVGSLGVFPNPSAVRVDDKPTLAEPG